jgi:catechol 2,3-dioxygenase-like lactoylglutathione lyase family enzyme
MNILKIKETCLYVSELGQSEDFYSHRLGFPVIGKAEGRHIFFRAGTSVLLCFISEKTRQDKNLPPHFGSGQLHLAFEVSPQEYQLWKDKVQQAGITIEHEQAWKDGLLSFYFRDPDGHLLEIVPTGIWE